MNFRLFPKTMRDGARHRSAAASRLPQWWQQQWWPTVLGILLTLLLLYGGVSRNLEAIASGFLWHWRDTSAWDQRVVVVKIDQPTLDALGWFPLRRDYYAALLERLSAAGQNTVVFDLIFSEESDADGDLQAAMLQHGQVVLGAAWTAQEKVWQPTPLLREAAIAVGHIAKEDHPLDAHITQIPPVRQDVPALSVAALQAYEMGGGEFPPVQLSRPIKINWPASLQTLKQYSFVDVLEGQIPPQQFDHKIVLIGVTVRGIDQLDSTIANATVHGVHLHAAAISNLLRQDSLKVFPIQWLPSLVVLLGFAWGRLLCGLRPPHRLFVMCLGPIVWIAGSILASLFYYRLPIALPVIIIGVINTAILCDDRWHLDQANQRLQQQITVDALTQVYNRYFLEQAFEVLWQRLMRERGEVALLLCDIDYFKLYNDTQGHPAGDRCLYQVAQAIQSCLKRPEDFVARYGGEELAVVLPQTTLNGAVQVAEQIQIALRHLGLAHPGTPEGATVTISIGIAAGLVSNLAPELLLQQADQALYSAKNLGRDRYFVTGACPKID